MSEQPHSLTLAEFIAWEERQPVKHEFQAGAVFARAGASDAHNQIVINLAALIRPALRGGACRAYANDMKLVTAFPGSRYPDLLVTCDARDAADRLTKRYPCLIVEVLSPSTAAQDATEKLDEYQTIAELDEYVLVDSRKRSVRIYRRNGALLETSSPVVSGSFRLRSIDLELTIDRVYEDVDERDVPLRVAEER